MSGYFAGPGNANDGAGGAETISGVARSKIFNILQWPEFQVEVTTPASYDRALTFQVTFDSATDPAVTPNWVNATYIETSSASSAVANGAFSPGATTRKIYKILTRGRCFSMNQSGGTVGNATWRFVANEDGSGLSQGISSGDSQGATTLTDGTATFTVAAALNTGTSLVQTGALVQADPDNTDDVFVGNATTQSVQLVPGQSVWMPVGNVNAIYAKANSGTQRVNWHSYSVS